MDNRKSLERIALKYGFRCAMVLILIFLVFYFFQSEFGDFYFVGRFIRFTDLGLIKYINLPVIFFIIYRGTHYFKMRYNYCVISYQKSVLSGIYISVIAIAITAFFSIIFYKFIDPTGLKLVLNDYYYNQREVSSVARAINFSRPYIITLLVSLIYTLLMSTFMKKEEHSH